MKQGCFPRTSSSVPSRRSRSGLPSASALCAGASAAKLATMVNKCEHGEGAHCCNDGS